MASSPTHPHNNPASITNQSAIQALDFASIIKASQVISSEIVLDRLLVKLMSFLLENANAQRGFLILEKAGSLVIEVQAEMGCEPTNVGRSIPLDSLSQQLCIAIVNSVAHSQEKVILGSAAREGLFQADPYIQQHQVKSVLCLPILHRGQFVGALYLENNLINEGFPEERVELLSILSSQAAISIENSRLYTDLEEKVEERTAQLISALEDLEELATTDKLTGLYNRRKFEEVLNAEIIRIQRFEHPGSLIIFDIDNFKDVNDTFGHQAGDEVLKRLSATVKAWLRNVDTLSRWGGDEYTILMPETDLKGATTLAEKIRLGVAVQKIPKAGTVTISLGVTEYRTGDSMESMLKRADEALYRAKRNGRDRVET